LDREQSEEKKGTLAFHTHVPNENKVEKENLYLNILPDIFITRIKISGYKKSKVD
jgi:hypothetical protein